MPGIDLDTAAASIRHANPEAASTAAAAEQLQELQDSQRLDGIRHTIEAGGTPSTDDMAFMKAKGLENEIPAGDGGGKGGEGTGDEPTLDQVKALEEKIIKGEDLTQEEQALADRIGAEKPNADVKYRVGGKEYQFEEMKTLALKDLGITPELAATIPDETMKGIVDNFHTKFNKAEWEKTNNRRAQDNARTVRDIGNSTVLLMNAQKNTRNDLAKAEAILAKVRELAATNVDPQDIYTDGKLDIEKQRKVTKVLDARDRIPEIEDQITSLKESSVQTERDLAAQIFRDFQSQHPEYRTSRDVLDVAAETGKGTITEEDEDRYEEMVQIFNQAHAMRVDADRQHARMLRQGKLQFKPENGSQTRDDPGKFQRDGDAARKRLLDNLRRKREHLSVGVSGGGRSDKGKSKLESGAEQIMVSARKYASGIGTVEQNLTESGY